MPAKTTRISVPEPCTKFRTEGSVLPDGRVHCNACAKTLVNYHSMSDAELIAFLQQHKKIPCGLFRPDQLDRPLVPESVPPPAGKRLRLSLLLPLALAWFTGHAQPAGNSSKAGTTQQSVKKNPQISVKVVSAATGEKIAGASVYKLDREVRTFLTQTDSNGIFRLDAAVYAGMPLLITSAGNSETIARIGSGGNLVVVTLFPVVEIVGQGRDAVRIEAEQYRQTGGIPVDRSWIDTIEKEKPHKFWRLFRHRKRKG